jgi:hypothetical protein
MAYPSFHQLHHKLADLVTLNVPVFHDTDNSPLYEDPYQGLLSHIVAANDVAALRLYHANPHTWTRVFWEDYMNPHWHPFLVAQAHGSCDALRALLEIYLSDPVYQMPKYPPLKLTLGVLAYPYGVCGCRSGLGPLVIIGQGAEWIRVAISHAAGSGKWLRWANTTDLCR